jgi:hypothetical protein
MKKKDKLLLALGLMMAGFGYLVSFEHKAAAAAGLCALILSMEAHSWKQIREAAVMAVLPMTAQLFLMKAVFPEDLPSLGILIAFNTLITCMWSFDEDEVLDKPMQYMMVCMTVSFLGAMILPGPFLSRMTGLPNQGFLQMITLIGFIYMPSCLLYVFRCSLFLREVPGTRLFHPEH